MVETVESPQLQRPLSKKPGDKLGKIILLPNGRKEQLVSLNPEQWNEGEYATEPSQAVFFKPIDQRNTLLHPAISREQQVLSKQNTILTPAVEVDNTSLDLRLLKAKICHQQKP